MPSPHFFAIQSRLGTKFPPFGTQEINYGVEKGGDALITPDFKFEIPGSQYTRFLIPQPEDVTEEEYFKVFIEQMNSVADQINALLQPNQIQVVLGGDHSVGVASFLALSKRIPAKDIGWIMFDSHGDIHLKSTSPSNNIHGMWVRMICDQFDDEFVQQVVKHTLSPDHLLYVGNLVVEQEEVDYMKSMQIPVISSQEIEKPASFKRLEAFIKSFPHIHLSVDIDVFDRQYAPATGEIVDNGFTPEQIVNLLPLFQNALSFSMDLVEVNPMKPGIDETAELGREVLYKTLAPLL